MDIPFFYEADLPATPELFTLSEESSKHCSVVLRMQPGETIALTNGEGMSCMGRLVSADKRKTIVQLSQHQQANRPVSQNAIAISFVKNASRMEWFLEKATEIGIASFYPLIAERTERTHFKKERWEHILISAMLQSMQVFKPVLHEPVEFKTFLQQPFDGHLLMAHCEEGPKQLIQSIDKNKPALLLIGPEGDFSPTEITMAEKAGATMISLGQTRLRTETAGIAAAVLLQHR